MTHLTAPALTLGDQSRATRALIAWHQGDRLVMDLVVAEVIDDEDPGATARFMFALLAFTAEVGDQIPDYAELLHARLALLAGEPS